MQVATDSEKVEDTQTSEPGVSQFIFCKMNAVEHLFIWKYFFRYVSRPSENAISTQTILHFYRSLLS